MKYWHVSKNLIIPSLHRSAHEQYIEHFANDDNNNQQTDIKGLIVGGVTLWLERQSLTGELSLIYA